MDLVPANGSEPPKTTGKGRVLFYRDAMNPSYTSDKPGKAPDGMDLVPVYEADNNGNFVKIDPAVVQNMGVRTEKAVRRSLSRDIRTSALVTADERRKYTVTTRVMGYVEKLYANYTGQLVSRGDRLFDLYSPELVSGQTEYLSALAAGADSDSRKLLSNARQRLLNWDITPEQIATLEKQGTAQKTMTIFSPASGIVTEKMVTEGQSVEPGMRLFTIVDYSRIWVVGSIYQQDIALVSAGQKAEVALDYYPGRRFTGTVSYVAPELDTISRTLMIRVDLANTPDFKIKPGMNATIVIRSTLAVSGLSVPDQAVIRSGLRTIAIVARGSGLFEPREITAGQNAGGFTQVIGGLTEGEEVVVSSQFLIDAESNLKSAVANMASQPKKDTVGDIYK
jgi:RND family efflux transporter MFP subunit